VVGAILNDTEEKPMNRNIHRLIWLVAALTLLLSGCLVVGHPRHPVVIAPAAIVVGPPVEYDYQPLLYDGYVVYYTDEGVPFYWVGGVRVWVPMHLRAHYVDHYRAHRGAYLHWYQHRGGYYRARRYKRHDNQLRHDPGRQHQMGPAHKPTLRPKDQHPRPLLKPKKKKKDKDDKPTLHPKR
jgi:hypothetical protein